MARRAATWSVLACLLVLLACAPALAQAQSLDPGTIVAPGDPRSDGQGPGLVGSPVVIAVGVVVLGVGTAAVTALVVRVRRRVDATDGS